MKVVAVCACTVGIAHTYMAATNIKEGFEKRGIDVSVETQGGLGIDGSLSQEDVDAADFVLLAIDVGIEGDDRFNAKREQNRVLKVGTSDAISDIDGIIDQVVDLEAKASAAGAKKAGLFDNFGSTIVNAFNTGVSYFIPVVVIGGVFLAISLATGTAGEDGMEVTNPFMQNLNTIGNAGIAMMIPVLAAYISYSIAGKPGLAPGFVLGYLANNSVTINNTEVSTGFLGAMVLGVAAGYFVKWMTRWNVGQTMATIMPVLIIPLLSTFVLGIIYIYVLAWPISIFMNWLESILGALEGGSAVILGIVIGIMTAVDMGGPINKTASTFTMALLADGVYGPNGMFRVAVAIPPIACGIAALVAKNKYDAADRQMGVSAIVMGCMGITEGAISFAVKDMGHTLPGIIIGSAVGAALAAWQGIQCYVPHGGFIVCFATDQPLLFCLDIVIGSLVGAAILIAMKPKLKTEEAEPAVEAAKAE